MIFADLVGLGQARMRLRKLTPKIIADTIRSMTRLVIQIQTHVKTKKLVGQVLNHISGNLSRNIFWDVEETGAGVVGSVYVGSGAPYGAIHEYGGVVDVPAHKRNMPETRRLISQAFGKPIKPRMVTFRAHEQQVPSHTKVYPERSFLRSALKDFRTQFREVVRELTDKVGGK